jgi:DNA repair exonuclease SbcCD ATPase subunit
MADVIFKVNDYVKWQIQGGFAFGKIVALKDDVASVELPLGSIANQKVDVLIAVDENAYQQALSEMIATLSTKTKQPAKANEESEMVDATKNAELTKAQDELVKVQKEVETLKAQLTEKETSCAECDKNMKEMEGKCKAAEAELAKAKEQLATIERERKAEARLAEIKGLDAVTAIDADEAKAKEKLGAMADEVYATTLALAKQFKALAGQTSFPKATDQTVTSAPKATDQTVTTHTKVTEAAEAVDQANTEKDTDLAAAAATAPAANEFQMVMAKVVRRGRNEESEKDSK